MTVRQFDLTSFDTLETSSVTLDGNQPETGQVLMLIGAEKTHELSGSVVMHQISVDHARSLVEGGVLSTRRSDFIFHEGLPYSARVFKGITSYSDPYITESSIEDLGIFVYGFCTATDEQVQRLLRASRFCAEHGINAERIVRIHLLKEIVDGEAGEKISTEVFRQRLVERFGSRIPKLEERLGKLHFIVWERVMPIAERVFDLDVDANPRQFFRIVRNVLNNVNRLEAIRGNDVHFSSRELNRFFIEYLIPNIARNLGKLHKQGVATSGYCFPSNIDLSGALCDLEDLIGIPIDPNYRPITEDDCVVDTHAAFSDKGILTLLITLQEKGKIQNAPDLISSARKAFFTTYFNERFGDDEKMSKIGEITKHISKLPSDVQIEILGEIYGVALLDALSPEAILHALDIETIQDVNDIIQAINESAHKNITKLFGTKYGQVPTDLIDAILKQFEHSLREGIPNYIGIVFQRYFLHKYNNDQSKLPDELAKALETYSGFKPLKLLEQLLGMQFNIGFSECPEMVILEYAQAHGLNDKEITHRNTYKALVEYVTKHVTNSLSGIIENSIIDRIAAMVVNSFVGQIGLTEGSLIYIHYANEAAKLYRRLEKKQSKVRSN